MTIRCVIACSALVLFGTVAETALAQPCDAEHVRPLNRRPNVILIMCDDLGWGDVDYEQRLTPTDAYTSKFEDPLDPLIPGPANYTPNLKSLAESGVRFHRFYAQAPICSPTRASFLTGRHYRRTLIDTVHVGPLPNRELTLAELAKTQGYVTGHFGKWHLGTMSRTVRDGISLNAHGSNVVGTGPGESSDAGTDYGPPWAHGYDIAYSNQVATNTYDPYAGNGVGNGNADYDDDNMIETAPGDRPKSLYWTEQGSFVFDDANRPAGYTSKVLTDEAIAFIDANQNEPFFMTIWYQIGHRVWTSDPNDTTLDQANFGPLAPCLCDHYYTSLVEFDKQIGALVKKLEDTGNLRDNTLIVFTSDNGPDPGGPGTASDLEGAKGSLKEGGIRVPGLFSWPGTIEADSETSALATVTDLAPTLLDLWDIDIPDSRPLDGVSILPVLLDSGQVFERDIYHNFSFTAPAFAFARTTPSGVTYKAFRPTETSPWELYDLDASAVENAMYDVASSNPTILNSMTQAWSATSQLIDDQRLAPDFDGTGDPDADSDYTDGIDGSVTGASVIVQNTYDFTPGNLQGDQPIVMVERQYATLTGNLTVDADGTVATFQRQGQLVPVGNVVIPEGEVVHSFLLYFESDAGAKTRVVEIDFDDEIIGVAWDAAKLVGSDGLAFAEPKFEDGPGDRVVFDDFSDKIEILDADSIRVTLSTAPGETDQVRVLTRSALQEEPHPCVADVDRDGDLDGDDVTMFQAGVAGGCAYADIADPIGTVDYTDLLLYLTLYGQGCP